MKKRFLTAIAAALPLTIMAQTAIDAYQLSRNDLRGTARFMSMGGAFGALGGDLSTLNQNPGGIGVYRKSDIGITLDIDIQGAKSSTPLMQYKQNQTKVAVNNVGYVGTTRTGSELMPFFNWGFTYNRAASFNRRFRGADVMTGSLSNYIANFTSQEKWSTNKLAGTEDNYFSYDGAPWMSILAYNSYMINPTATGANTYNGLWGNGTTGENEFDVEESGYVDEYEINFGGNFTDMVYWGIGFGITDLEYNQNVYYQEFLQNAQIPEVNSDGEVVSAPPTPTDQEVGFGLESRKRITGSGFNFKAGVIVRPINELRLGLAIHTPTYYNLTQYNDGTVDYGYGYSEGELKPGYTSSPTQSVDWKLRTPWRLIASAAVVIGPSAIISADYEYRPYQNMTTKFDNGDNVTDVNNDIKNYYKAANIVRIGAEYRLNNHLSLRAGYAYESTPTGSEVRNDNMQVYTSGPYDTGTTPSYTLDNSTQYITCGIGYRYKGFYADAAYVNKQYKSDFHAFTPSLENDRVIGQAPAEIKQSNNNIVLTVGFKF
ncbi:MAG: outer membrane protein transport protein [Firmicutes bacterium]|nr:outer membrane protein transport protein [Bacillota bacterium]MCM1477950.1 outer membrane protein transport protein [Bacteroides sp.]